MKEPNALQHFVSYHHPSVDANKAYGRMRLRDLRGESLYDEVQRYSYVEFLDVRASFPQVHILVF